MVPAAARAARSLSQSLGLLILLTLPAWGADSWRPLLLDGERLPGPGVWVRDSRPFFPVVVLGRKLRCPVGVNRVTGVLVVQGREVPTEIVLQEGIVFVPQAGLQTAFPQLVVQDDGLAVMAWSSPPKRAAAVPSEGLVVLGATPSVQDGRLRLDVEAGNSNAREPRGGAITVTFQEADGRTYAEFRQTVDALAPGERRLIPVPVWLTPSRLMDGSQVEVELHGSTGDRVERRVLRWRVEAR